MGKAEIMVVGTILKAILVLVGIVLTLKLLIVGLARDDGKMLKKAGLMFLGMCALIIVLGTIEFLILKEM